MAPFRSSLRSSTHKACATSASRAPRASNRCRWSACTPSSGTRRAGPSSKCCRTARNTSTGTSPT
eukprot:9857587-Alexandrium_andersonii.AAC.1